MVVMMLQVVFGGNEVDCGDYDIDNG